MATGLARAEASTSTLSRTQQAGIRALPLIRLKDSDRLRTARRDADGRPRCRLLSLGQGSKAWQEGLDGLKRFAISCARLSFPHTQLTHRVDVDFCPDRLASFLRTSCQWQPAIGAQVSRLGADARVLQGEHRQGFGSGRREPTLALLCSLGKAKLLPDRGGGWSRVKRLWNTYPLWSPADLTRVDRLKLRRRFSEPTMRGLLRREACGAAPSHDSHTLRMEILPDVPDPSPVPAQNPPLVVQLVHTSDLPPAASSGSKISGVTWQCQGRPKTRI